MKYLICIVLCLFKIVCYAQQIDPNITLGDGRTVNCTHAFLDGESATFTLRGDYPSEKIKWRLSIRRKKKSPVAVLDSEIGCEDFTFNTNPNLLKFLGMNRECQRIKFPGDSSVYIKGTVYLTEAENCLDSMNILFNVLPSSPIVKNAVLTGIFNFARGDFNSEAQLNVSFTSNLMERCYVALVQCDTVHPFICPKDQLWIVEWKNSVDEHKIHKVEQKNVDWGEFYIIGAGNEYGSSSGDTICTTCLIKDPDIINAIVNEEPPTLSIHKPSTYDNQLYFDGEVIHFPDKDSNALYIKIYNYCGHLLFQGFIQNEISMKEYPHGLYIIQGKYNNKTLTKKIIK